MLKELKIEVVEQETKVERLPGWTTKLRTKRNLTKVCPTMMGEQEARECP